MPALLFKTQKMAHSTEKNWISAASAYTDRRAITMLMLGFAAGTPLLLIFSTLGLWLQEAGVERKTVTMFSWAALAYSFKFIWSPLIDTLPLPFLTRAFGRRRAWLLLAQCAIIVAILCMASVDPIHPQSLILMALSAVLLGFSAATQDIVVDSYRIEAAPDDSAMQSVMSSTFVAGYRIGMIVAGAGSLFLATWFGTGKDHYLYEAWRNTYFVMALIMGVGVLTTLMIREPEVNHNKTSRFSVNENFRLIAMFAFAVLGLLAGFQLMGMILPSNTTHAPLTSFLLEAFRLIIALGFAIIVANICIKIRLTPKSVATQAFVEPLADFFRRYGKRALLLLALIGLYRIHDIVAGTISNIFYADMGFSKDEIATAVKTFGVAMSILGGFAGGMLAQRFAIMKMMLLGAAFSASTLLLFVALSFHGHHTPLMYTAVGFDNFAGGLASTVFVAFLSSLTNIRFSAVQYALFSSMMTLIPKTIGGYSGAIVDNIGYAGFFTFTATLGIPIVILVLIADKLLFKNK